MKTKLELRREALMRRYPGTRTCRLCRETKPIADYGTPPTGFRIRRGVVTWHRGECLACRRILNNQRKARRERRDTPTPTETP